MLWFVVCHCLCELLVLLLLRVGIMFVIVDLLGRLRHLRALCLNDCVLFAGIIRMLLELVFVPNGTVAGRFLRSIRRLRQFGRHTLTCSLLILRPRFCFLAEVLREANLPDLRLMLPQILHLLQLLPLNLFKLLNLHLFLSLLAPQLLLLRLVLSLLLCILLNQ